MGLYPLYRAWGGLQGTTLRSALIWAVAAWLLWSVTILRTWGDEVRYLATCVTACAGIAVLGARRPGVGAWNFVVAGLLAALCRPFLQGLGELRLETAHLIFLGAVLLVGIGNYLPTRMGPAAVVLALWGTMELFRLGQLGEVPRYARDGMLGFAPWVGWWCWTRDSGDTVDCLWRRFRDRFGFLWAQRTRDQFQRAAENADLNVELRWSGVVGEASQRERSLELLRALLRRFDSNAPEQD